MGFRVAVHDMHDPPDRLHRNDLVPQVEPGAARNLMHGVPLEGLGLAFQLGIRSKRLGENLEHEVRGWAGKLSHAAKEIQNVRNDAQPTKH